MSFSLDSLPQSLATIVAALIAVVGVALTILHNRKMQWNKDAQTAKVIAAAVKSDIHSITLALKETKLVDSFISAYQNGVVLPWADAPRKSDYFQLFGAVAPQIGALPLELAQETVRFYTFLRIARDAAEPLGEIRKEAQGVEKVNPNEDEVKHHARNVLVSLQDCLDAAAFVLNSEVSDDRDKGKLDNGIKQKPKGDPEGDLAKVAIELLEQIKTVLSHM
jgi:hypothetical protein